jgi:hypothetical protein
MSAHVADHHRRDHLRGFAGDISKALGGDEDLGAAIRGDIGNLARRQMRADCRVIEPAALRRPADLEELQGILSQQRDVVLRLQAERAEQLSRLVRGSSSR